MADPDGNPRNHLIKLAAERDHDGKIIGVLAFGRDITEYKKIEHDLRASRQKLRDLSIHQQLTIEEERKKIARELHDDLGQMLTGIKLDAMWLEAHLSDGQLNIANKIASMSKLIDDTLDAMHRVASALRPTMLDDLGLVSSIEWLTEEFGTRTSIGIQLGKDMGQQKYGCGGFCSKEVCSLDEVTAISAYRIVQECLTNIARHAQATHIQVYLKCRDEELMIRVSDDGKGMTPGYAGKRNSFGIIGMRERAYGLGGKLTISSAPGKGAIMETVLPIKSVNDVRAPN